MQDFMPLLGWDHLELWVGNAKQSAYFYEGVLGFTRTAYAGPETGLRDRASYVLEQGEIRLVLTTALREDNEITRHHARHGDGVRDIALTVPDATEAYRQAVQRGARGVREPTRLEDDQGAVQLASIATYGDTSQNSRSRSAIWPRSKPRRARAVSHGGLSAASTDDSEACTSTTLRLTTRISS